MTSLLLAVVMVLAGPAIGDAPDVKVRFSPKVGEVGLLMQLSLVISGPEAVDCDLTQVPEVDGADLTLEAGPNSRQSTVIANGQIQRTVETEWIFRLVPDRAGTLRIPPFLLNCRGEGVATLPTVIPVTEGTFTEPVVDMRLRLPAGTDLWVGQTFDVEVYASIDEDYTDRVISGGLGLTLAWYDGVDGLVRLEPPALPNAATHIHLNNSRRPIATQVARDTIDGTVWRIYKLTVPMVASRAGRVTLPPSHFTATLAASIEKQRDPFDLLGIRRRNVVTRAVESTASSPGLELNVREPPTEGRPSYYTNAMGRFSFTGAAAPRKLRVGETCTLTVQLDGGGNLAFVEWPPFDELSDDFRIFGKEERRGDDVQRLAIEISPKNVHVMAIPELRVATFDPEAGVYETLTVGPFPIEVSGGGEEGLPELSAPEEILNDLETIRETLPPARGRSWPPWVWALPGLFALAVVETRRRLDRWHRDHPREVARRGARRALEQQLKQADDTRDVAVAFGKFLAGRLGGPPAGLTADEAAGELTRRGADPALIDELRRVVAGWEAAYLGGESLDVDIVRSEARELAGGLEAAT